MTDEIVTDDTLEVAVRAHLEANNMLVDAYMLSSGEKRLGLTGTSLALGYRENWLGRLLTRDEGKQLEALQDMGFTGYQIPVKVVRELDHVRGASIAKTIGKRDFVKLLGYESFKKKNVRASIILFAFAESGVDDVIDRLFTGQSVEDFSLKIVHYSEWTPEDWEEVLACNREDLEEQLLGVW